MKKFLLVLIILLLPFCLYAKTTFNIGIDSLFIQDFVFGYGDIQTNFKFRVDIEEDFSFDVPITISFPQKGKQYGRFYDIGIFLCYFPWERGPYISVSLIQLGFFPRASEIEDRIIGLNEVTFGWKFKILKDFSIEPQISVRDPSETFSEEYSFLRGIYSSYSSFRLRIIVSWDFLNIK